MAVDKQFRGRQRVSYNFDPNNTQIRRTEYASSENWLYISPFFFFDQSESESQTMWTNKKAMGGGRKNCQIEVKREYFRPN